MGEKLVGAGSCGDAEQTVLTRAESNFTGQRQSCSGAGAGRARRDKAEEGIREPLVLRQTSTYDMRCEREQQSDDPKQRVHRGASSVRSANGCACARVLASCTADATTIRRSIGWPMTNQLAAEGSNCRMDRERYAKRDQRNIERTRIRCKRCLSCSLEKGTVYGLRRDLST